MGIRIGLLMVALWIAAGGMVAAQEPLTLVQVQEIAEESNALLKVAQAHIARARAQKLQAWAGHLPSVRVSEGVMRSNDAVNAFGSRLKQERFSQADFAIDALNFPKSIVNFQTKIEVRQPLFNGGQAIYGRRQANVNEQIALGNFERMRSQINFEAARAYWGLVLAREALLAVQQGLATAQAHARIAEVRYEQETADRVDLLAARVRVAELSGEEIEAQNQVASAIDGLALVMGVGIGTDLQVADVLSRRPLPANLDVLIERAKRARPDLKVARLAVEETNAGVGKARSAF
ncbi:MAG: TolC family protein, partial [Candidatus Latescibacteria bacterium]|nr:TolC family protein [Candidatus Latescibacterota bacterium]